ncbi:Selenide, water dikinase 1 [Hondaea fermentalgiana]|uniref:Selenide, water dikinase 1 n=1 Tax=Hondaea fermentalgiana TaxID=2315210 RepID=A0A2R5GA61_9STRA|nr:Selenide, water dikinase 1 [Hondaea fermentalgiana]|eukprot:GBG27907.1 Selenide, water dikinase 1 [Hondaea fermentalgiana]
MMGAAANGAGPVSRDLVLVGGGHAHAFVVKNMGMKPEPGLAVTLITPQVDTPYSGMLPGHIAGQYEREECHIDLVRLCQFGGVRLVIASATSIDLDQKLVHVDDPERPPIRYDVLSIDIGSAPQIKDSALSHADASLVATPVKPIWQFSERWDALVRSIESRVQASEEQREEDDDQAQAQAQAQGGAGAESGSAKVDELTIGVVGAGAGGVELALSMQYRLEGLSSQHFKIKFVLFSNKKVVCPSHSRAVQKKFARILEERGVSVVYNFEVVGIEESRLRAADGRIVNVDECIWCTSARTQDWMGGSGLAVDNGGFVRVKQTLESESTPNVFAAGDCANMLDHPRPKAGVFAVRQGPPLAANLRRAVRNLSLPASASPETLEEYIPQKSFLGLIGTGRPYCVASRGEIALEGKWLWKMKDYIDRKWMAGFTTQLPIMAGESHNGGAGEGTEENQSLEALTQASLMRCGGCGAKVGKSVLDRVVQNLNPPTRAEVEVGLDHPDDCAVVQFDSAHDDAPKVVQTVDFFRSFVDDPYIFGQIAAIHALSDCHAMCAEAVTAMAIAVVPFAAERVVEGTLTQLMAGANTALRDSNCALVGGHSCEGKDLALGLSVSGVVQPGQRILTKGGVLAGDALIVTKPVGTGTLFAANMRVLAKGAWVEGAIKSMLVSNKYAALLARDHDATACTDITGFGLIGHLVEMMQASDPSLMATVQAEDVPMLEGAAECVEAGIFSSLQPQNTPLVAVRAFDSMGNGLSTTGDKAASVFIATLVGSALATPDLFDLKKQFAFYASYHTDWHNQLVHFGCIWPILWTTCAMLHKTSPIFGPATKKDGEESKSLQTNWATVASILYAGYYFLMDETVGRVASAMVVATYFTSGWWVNSDPKNFKRAFGIHVLAWVAQFLAHRFCEGRAPALFDNLSQALLMAPLFVVFEGAHMLGFRQEFFAEVRELVAANVMAFRLQGGGN